mgnify:FL=1
MIEIENLRKVFDKNVVALDDFNLEIENGEFVALLGPSGCGKSTTLNCLAGLLDPTSGRILFDGKDVTKWAPKDRNIGMVFQSYALYPNLTVIDNIAFPLKQKGVDKKTRREKARTVAEKLQIGHLLGRRPSQLSGGQQQRVAMCRAIVKEPKLLLLDEPMSNLDARLKIEIRSVIKKIHQDLGIIAILVTHDQEEAMALADKIAILDGGKIQQYDTPDELYENPANLFVANFMGNPPMNFIDAHLCEDGSLEIGDRKIHNRIACIGGPYDDDVKIGMRSHQIPFSFSNSPESFEMTISYVENLGKELLVYGYSYGSEVRLSISDKSLHEKLLKAQEDKRPLYLSLGGKYHIFLVKNGRNITYSKEEIS